METGYDDEQMARFRAAHPEMPPAEELTGEVCCPSIEAAEERIRWSMAYLRDSPDFYIRDYTLGNLRRRLEALKRGEVEWCRNLWFLRKVLSATYVVEYEVESGPCGYTDFCFAPEFELYFEVVLVLVEYLQLGAKLAQECHSSSVEQWREGYMLLRANCGSYDDVPFSSADAHRMVELIYSASEALSADMDLFGRGATSEVSIEQGSIDRLGTAIASERAALNAARRKPRGRRGTGLKGTRTARMEEQLAAFRAWMAGRQVVKGDRSRTVGAYAARFWREHSAEYAADAKREGEKRGYGEPKLLARAYRDSKS